MLKRIFFLVLVIFVPLFAQSKSELTDKVINFYSENRLFSGAVLVTEHGSIIYNKAFGQANIDFVKEGDAVTHAVVHVNGNDLKCMKINKASICIYNRYIFKNN